MDRKYKQKGYQDSGREERPRESPKKSDVKSPKMTSFHDVTRCALCGSPVNIDLGGIAFSAQCPRCNSDLHSCKNCVNFDPGARFQCRKPVTERVTKKDMANECPQFEPKKTVEKEITSAPVDIKDPRIAFDRLFKK